MTHFLIFIFGICVGACSAFVYAMVMLRRFARSTRSA